MAKKEKTVFTVSVNEKLLNEFKEMCKEQNKFYSGCSEEAMKLWLDRYYKEKKES